MTVVRRSSIIDQGQRQMHSFLGTVADTLKCENQMSAMNDGPAIYIVEPQERAES